MDQTRRQDQQSSNTRAPAPAAARAAAPPAAAQAKAKPAPPPARQAPAQPPPPKASAPPPRAEPPVAQPAPVEHLTIAPQALQTSDPAIEFDWEPAALGTNRSYSCTVTTDPAHGLSVSLEQGMYRRSFQSQGALKISVIPPAPATTKGSLTATDLTTGGSATFTWQWQPRSAGASAAPAKPAGLLGRLFARAKAVTAVTAKAQSKGKTATVAERLGERAPLAVAMKFFGQEAVGQRFAFILDRSGSMSGRRWEACVKQLVRALRALPEHVEFFVVLFSSRDVEPRGQSGWMRAERGRVEDVIGWIRGSQSRRRDLPGKRLQARVLAAIASGRDLFPD